MLIKIQYLWSRDDFIQRCVLDFFFVLYFVVALVLNSLDSAINSLSSCIKPHSSYLCDIFTSLLFYCIYNLIFNNSSYQQLSFLIEARSDCRDRAITISSVSRVIVVESTEPNRTKSQLNYDRSRRKKKWIRKSSAHRHKHEPRLTHKTKNNRLRWVGVEEFFFLFLPFFLLICLFICVLTILTFSTLCTPYYLFAPKSVYMKKKIAKQKKNAHK